MIAAWPWPGSSAPRGSVGAVRVELLTDWPERLAPGAELWLEGATEPMRIIARRDGRPRAPVLHLDGVTTREAAEAVAGRYLETPAEALPRGDLLLGRPRRPARRGARRHARGRAGRGLPRRRRRGLPHRRRGGERLVPALRSGRLRRSTWRRTSWSSLPTRPRRFAEPMRIDVVTIFPELFVGPLRHLDHRARGGGRPGRVRRSTTCASTGWGGIGPWTTIRTAGEREW